MSIVIISFTCCFLQIYDDFYGPFFNDISGGILNDYLHLHLTVKFSVLCPYVLNGSLDTKTGNR